MDEKYSNAESCVVVIILDLAEIIALSKSTQHLWTQSFLGRDNEVGMTEEYLGEGEAVVEAIVEEKEICLLEIVDEFVNEFVFRSRGLAVDEAQGCTANKVEQAAKLDSDGAQSLLAVVRAERLPKRLRFGQGESGLVSSKETQPVPTAVVVVLGGSLQPRHQSPIQPR